MIREERINRIIEELAEERSLSTTSLMAKFSVTEGTIRRDLNELQSRGILKKVHGGAIPALTDPHHLSGRLITATENKKLLAIKAQHLIKADQLLLIDGGSTNLALVKEIDKEIPLTVYTNSIPIAAYLITYPNVTLHLLGGRVLKSSEVTLDILTFQELSRIKADLCFIGVRSIHPDIGIATLSADEAQLKKKMIEVSDQTVILVTNEKLFTSDHYVIVSLEEIDTLVVEEDANHKFIQRAIKSGIEVIK